MIGCPSLRSSSTLVAPPREAQIRRVEVVVGVSCGTANAKAVHHVVMRPDGKVEAPSLSAKVALPSAEEPGLPCARCKNARKKLDLDIEPEVHVIDEDPPERTTELVPATAPTKASLPLQEPQSVCVPVRPQ